MESAIQNGDLEKVRKLLDSGANVNKVNPRTERTPLSFAVSIDKPEIAKLLIERGANIHTPDADGATPLLLATQHRNNFEVSNLLIEKGARVNTQNNSGETPLMSAVALDDLKLAKLLIDRGANVNKENVFEPVVTFKFPLLYALSSNRNEMAKLLIESGADVNVMDGHALQLAQTDEIRNLIRRKMMKPVIEVGAKKRLPSDLIREIGKYVVPPRREQGGRRLKTLASQRTSLVRSRSRKQLSQQHRAKTRRSPRT